MKIKYVGMDVHLATTTCVVLDEAGKLLQSSVLQTKAEFICGFLKSLKGEIHLTFEETTLAHWLFELTKPLVFRVLVCNPRKLNKKEQKNDWRDALDLANSLRLNELQGVYHHCGREFSQLKQLVVGYEQLTADRTRLINRLRSVYREQAMQIELKGLTAENLPPLPTRGHLERAKLLLSELETVTNLREKALAQMLKEATEHPAYQLLQSLPGISLIRAAQLLAWVITPHRFRSKRQFWSYCGLKVICQSSSDYEVKNGALVKKQKVGQTFGLTKEYHRGLKNLFKGATLDSLRNKQIRAFYEQLVNRGLKESVARVQIARKLAASCLAVWKSGEKFAIERLVS